MPGPTEPTSNRTALPQPDVTRAYPLDAQDTSVANSTEIQAGREINLGPPASADEIGMFGPYRVVRELGRGGMGSVFLAIDTRLDRKLALKVMLPQLAADPIAQQRFLREARATAKVTNDNVVTVYEADERDGVTYIAMQFLQGYPLDEYLRKKGRPSISQIIRIARETASGLAAAHKTGLIHRDIKPANLWLEAPKGRVKVLDFGLAKPVDGDVEVTQSGLIIGTPAYMSPEQARGLKLDGRTDLFSLGTVLYYLCAGRYPFEGPTPMAVLTALAADEPQPLLEINPAVPPPLADLIHQLLAKNPDKRPRTADELVQRLRAIEKELARPAAHLSITAIPERDPFADIDMTAVAPFPVATTPATRESEWKWVWVAGGAVAVVLLFLVGLILATRGGGAQAKKDLPDGVQGAEPNNPAAPSVPKPAVDPPSVELSKGLGESSDPAVILEQARAHAARREWKKAAEAYAEIINLPGPDWGETAFEYAAVLVLNGDQAAYKKQSGLMVDRAGKWDVRPYHVARACTLAADSFTPAERPAEMAQKEMDFNGTSYFWQWLQGAQHYRAARFPEALDLLQKSRDDKDQPPDGVAGVRLWMALTYYKLNKPEEARREFEQAEKWLANYPGGLPTQPERKQLGLHLHNWLEVHVMQAEVAALLRPGPIKGK